MVGENKDVTPEVSQDSASELSLEKLGESPVGQEALKLATGETPEEKYASVMRLMAMAEGSTTEEKLSKVVEVLKQNVGVSENVDEVVAEVPADVPEVEEVPERAES